MDRLIDVLMGYGIQLIVDVRRWPRSRIAGYDRDDLEYRLNSKGISYLWMGGELGGYRSGGYEKHVESICFKEAISKLIEIASSTRLCILCLESDPRRCHRRFIAEALIERGVEVIHIILKRKSLSEERVKYKDAKSLE
ncbi:MAG: DUF488 domain-containing protein [Candidatus Bathyarchaeota archaeon]|nr:DUF488 domain-containing protein [Candidatus Bathyarchaeota archaeon]